MLRYNVPPEAPSHLDSDPSPQQWPTKGHIVFQNVSLRYRENLPLVLKKVLK